MPIYTPMYSWLAIQTFIQRASASVAILMNCVLFLLIVRKSPKSLGAYKYLMLYIALFEIGYAISDILLRPEIHTKGDCWVVALDSQKTIVPRSWLYFIDIVWCGSFGISLANFGVHFIFRYLTVCGNQKWTSGFSVLFYQSASMVYGITWMSLCHIFLQKSSEVDHFIQTELEEFQGRDLDEIAYLGFCFYQLPDEFGVERINWYSVFGASVFSSLLSISSTTMFVFGAKCYLKITNMVHHTMYSEHSRALQYQMFFALVFQTLIPFVLMHIPCALVYVCAIVGGADEIFGKALTISVPLFPALDPLPGMIIIADYRNAISDFFKKMLRCGQVTFKIEPAQTLTNQSGTL